MGRVLLFAFPGKYGWCLGGLSFWDYYSRRVKVKSHSCLIVLSGFTDNEYIIYLGWGLSLGYQGGQGVYFLAEGKALPAYSV